MGEQVDTGAIQRHYEAIIADLRAKLEQAELAVLKAKLAGGLESDAEWVKEYAAQRDRAEQAEEWARQGWAESHANAQTAADAIIGRDQAEARVRRLEEAWAKHSCGTRGIWCSAHQRYHCAAVDDALNPPSVATANIPQTTDTPGGASHPAALEESKYRE